MLLAALLGTLVAPVDLSRVFAKGERAQYEVSSHLLTETRGSGLRTWMPETHDFQYEFSLTVLELLADGVARARYQRPHIVVSEQGLEDDEPKKRVEKVNLDYELRLSSINEILQAKDLAPPKLRPVRASGGGSQDLARSFISELYRLAVFVGSMDSSLDLSPKLPFDAASPGDTWKRTIGFQPQRLASGRSAVQRLDYVYSYMGIVEMSGNKVHRIEANLALDSDAAEFVNQLYEGGQKATGLTKLPLKLTSKIEYDLDFLTRKTLVARATSSGGFSIHVEGARDPVVEVKLKGRSTMKPTK